MATLFFTACSLPQITTEAPGLNEIKAGKKFKVNLPENHSTGYTWQLNREFDKNVVLDINAVWHGNEKGIDFNFEAQKAGQTTLTFVQRSYSDTLNVKTFIVKIVDK